MNINIIADKDAYIVVEKPSGLLAHETSAGETETLSRWIIEKYPEISYVGEDAKRPGMMHRLDKEASGIIVIAKTQEMYNLIKKQFQKRTIEKEYIVLVHGIISADHGVIDFDIDRGREGRMASRPKTDALRVKNVPHIQKGKEAITEFFVEKRFARFTLLRVKIHTGRTHQIRVHMLAYNHPVVGDKVYVNSKLNLKRDKELGRLFLHAARLCFDDLKGSRVCYESPLPENLLLFLAKLK